MIRVTAWEPRPGIPDQVTLLVGTNTFAVCACEDVVVPGGMGEQSLRLRERGGDSGSREDIDKRCAADAEKGWTADVQPLLLLVFP